MEFFFRYGPYWDVLIIESDGLQTSGDDMS